MIYLIPYQLSIRHLNWYFLIWSSLIITLKFNVYVVVTQDYSSFQYDNLESYRGDSDDARDSLSQTPGDNEEESEQVSTMNLCSGCPVSTSKIKLSLYKKDHAKHVNKFSVSRYHVLMNDQVVFECTVPEKNVLPPDKIWRDSTHMDETDDEDATVTNKVLPCPADGSSGNQNCLQKLSVLRLAVTGDNDLSNTVDNILTMNYHHYDNDTSFTNNSWIERFLGWSIALITVGQTAFIKFGFRAMNLEEQGGIYFCDFSDYHTSKSDSREGTCLCPHRSQQGVHVVIHERPQNPAIFSIYLQGEEELRDIAGESTEDENAEGMRVIIFDGTGGNKKIGCMVGKVFPEIRVNMYANWTNKTPSSKVLMDESLQDLRWTSDDTFYLTTDINLDESFDNAIVTCEWKSLYMPFTITDNKVRAVLRMMSSPRTVEITANKAYSEKTADYLIYDMSPGEILEFYCKGTAAPPPYFEWIRNGSLYQIGPKLILTNFALIKRSEIACVARNKLGSIMSTKVLVVFKPGPIDKMSTAPILTMSILNEEKIETTSSLAKADDIIDSKADDIIDSKADVDAKIDAKNSDQKDHKREESPISHDVINGDVNREMIDPSEDRKERSMQSDSFVVKRGFDCEIDTDCVLHSENARCHKNQCECLSGELMTRYTRCSRVKKAAKSLGEKLSQNGPFIIGMVIMTFFTVFGISLVISQVLKKRIVSIDNPVVTSVNAKDRTTLAPGKTKTIPSAVNIRTK